MSFSASAAVSKNAIIELRQFQLRNTADDMRGRTSEHLGKAFLPALKRAGAGPAGLFTSSISPDSPYILMVSSYASLGDWDSIRDKVGQDKEYQKARDAFYAAGLTYVRMETSLLRAFDTVPNIEVPPGDEKRPARVFELRTYESNNLGTLRRKVSMFNSGEIGVFRRLNMLPVFFGERIAGPNMPSLTYMLAFDDLAAREKAWRAFGADAEWKKMRVQPGFSDAEIVSNISNVILTPLPASPIR